MNKDVSSKNNQILLGIIFSLVANFIYIIIFKATVITLPITAVGLLLLNILLLLYFIGIEMTYARNAVMILGGLILFFLFFSYESINTILINIVIGGYYATIFYISQYIKIGASLSKKKQIIAGIFAALIVNIPIYMLMFNDDYFDASPVIILLFAVNTFLIIYFANHKLTYARNTVIVVGGTPIILGFIFGILMVGTMILGAIT